MIAEILSTGDEVLSGAVVDTNAAFIADHLQRAGVRVSRHVCVGDDINDISSAVSEMGKRADIVVATGGLGPTMDDLMAAAAARAAKVSLEENKKARESVEAFFARFSRKMTRSDAKQAMLPKGAEPIINDAGTAPGFSMKISRALFFFLPGVPREMERMLLCSVIPRIKSDCLSGVSSSVNCRKVFSLFGLPEAEVNERIRDLEKVYDNLKFGMIARFPVIFIKLTAMGNDEPALNQSIDAAGRDVVKRLGKWIFSENGESMEEVVGRLLSRLPASLAIAESCTGGLIASRITDIAGSSNYFLFSAVTYSNQAKTGVLGIDPELIDRFGAVSEETAQAMAEGVRRLSGADYGLSASGIAGPGGGTDEKPVGTVCIGLASSNGTKSKKFWFPFGRRNANKRIFSEAALDFLRRELMAAGQAA